MSQKCEQFSYGTFGWVILGFLVRPPHKWRVGGRSKVDQENNRKLTSRMNLRGYVGHPIHWLGAVNLTLSAALTSARGHDNYCVRGQKSLIRFLNTLSEIARSTRCSSDVEHVAGNSDSCYEVHTVICAKVEATRTRQS